MQRALGPPLPLGLLRWAATDHHRVIRGLAEDFAGLSDATRLHYRPSRPDHVLDTPYATLHTFQSLAGLDEAAALRRGLAALAHLRRALLQDLREGRKTFVFASKAPDFAVPEMHALKAAIARHGPAALLCVTPCAEGQAPHPPARLAPGLYAARIAGFVASDGPYDEWLRILEGARALRVEEAPA